MKFFSLGIFVVAAKRTPFGTYGGKFVKTSSAELQEIACKAALASGNIAPNLIDSVVIGNVLGVSILFYFILFKFMLNLFLLFLL